MLRVPLLYLSEWLSRFFRHPVMRQLRASHPRIYNFVQGRFSMKHFFGLPFTLVLVLAWLNVALLSELTENVVNSPKMKTIDADISRAFFDLRKPWLSKALFLFTQAGSYYGLLTVGVLASVFLLLKRKGFYLLGLLVSVLGSGLAVKITKAYFVRERPLDIGYYTETSFSFPSGHATGAMALEGFICYLLIMEARKPGRQLFWFITGALYILIMGFSRIYLGVHFISDVLAGYLLGFLWLLFGIVLMEFAALRKVYPKKKKVP